jgi:hypothetical protein
VVRPARSAAEPDPLALSCRALTRSPRGETLVVVGPLAVDAGLDRESGLAVIVDVGDGDLDAYWTTRYHRWVTNGDSTTWLTSSEQVAGSTSSKSRTPPPSRTGARCSCSSSSKSALRAC